MGKILKILAAFFLILIASTCLIAVWHLRAKTETTHTESVATPPPLKQEPARAPSDWHEIRNENCGFTYFLPEGWMDGGYLGESKVVSPADEAANEAWNKANQDLIAHEEGESPLGADARSLYMDCQYGAHEMFGRDSDAIKTFADVVSSGRFNESGTGSAIIGTIPIGTSPAYEMRSVSESPVLGTLTRYELYLDLANGKLLTIDLGNVEYADLNETVKEVIASIRD